MDIYIEFIKDNLNDRLEYVDYFNNILSLSKINNIDINDILYFVYKKIIDFSNRDDFTEEDIDEYLYFTLRRLNSLVTRAKSI